MTQYWSPPSCHPLKRLQVSDGLLMNAKRWRLAHQYHRLRQNLHYQSLNQPGIVEGLGVSPIEAPEDVRAQYRDRRWLQIQPGIAIDVFGNPIIVPHPIEFRLASENRSPKALTVYLIVRYVDPENLNRKQSGDLVEETFRIDEKTEPPAEADVELCRLILPGNSGGNGVILPVELTRAADVFQPQYSQPNFLYRQTARSRPQTHIEIAGIEHANTAPEGEEKLAQLNALVETAEALGPLICGANSLTWVNPIKARGTKEVETEENRQDLERYHLLYFPLRSDPSLSEAEEYALRDYLRSGGTIFADIVGKPTDLMEILKIQQELYGAIAETERDLDLAASREDLIAELNSLHQELSMKVSRVFPTLELLAKYSQGHLESLIGLNHPLQTQPFSFSALPIINNRLTYLAVGGGVILSLGNLSAAWKPSVNLVLSREILRSAQELGLNILYFAWRRKQLMQWQTSPLAAETGVENLEVAAKAFSHPFDLTKKTH
ncbi:MAG: DUF4159 domain-containing protein [Cyanobacteria bacterium SBLK]|nr:DUF4159 domain-containing protein [Cyanobacteria bacterium SBLK]